MAWGTGLGKVGMLGSCVMAEEVWHLPSLVKQLWAWVPTSQSPCKLLKPVVPRFPRLHSMSSVGGARRHHLHSLMVLCPQGWMGQSRTLEKAGWPSASSPGHRAWKEAVCDLGKGGSVNNRSLPRTLNQ